MKTLKNREADENNGTPIGAPKPPGPATTQTDRAVALTPQTRTVHRPTRRGTRKNTQRNTRQTNNDRKQTQNNRRTTQNKTLSVARKKSGFARGAQVESWTLIPYSQSSNWFQLHNSPMSTAFNCNCTATLFSRWFCASNSWFPLGSSLSF